MEKQPLLAIDVAEQLPGATLLIAGDGPMSDELRRRITDASADIRLLGPVADVRPLLWASNLLVITSRTEGIPGVAVEAMLSGTHVVAPAVGGLPDLLGPDHPGLFRPVSEPMRSEDSGLDIIEAIENTLSGSPTTARLPVSTEETVPLWVSLLQTITNPTR